MMGTGTGLLGCTCYGEGSINCGEYCDKCNSFCIFRCGAYCEMVVCSGVARRIVS